MPIITPDTGAYLVLGLAVTGIALVGYIASVVLRFRSAAQDEAMLHELQA